MDFLDELLTPKVPPSPPSTAPGSVAGWRWVREGGGGGTRCGGDGGWVPDSPQCQGGCQRARGGCFVGGFNSQCASHAFVDTTFPPPVRVITEHRTARQITGFRNPVSGGIYCPVCVFIFNGERLLLFVPPLWRLVHVGAASAPCHRNGTGGGGWCAQIPPEELLLISDVSTPDSR